MHPISFIHSKTNAHTHTLTQLIDKTKQSNHLEQMQNIIYPPNANYLILCTRTHTSIEYMSVYDGLSFIVTKKKILFKTMKKMKNDIKIEMESTLIFNS